MSALRIVPVDPAEEALFAAWHAAYVAAEDARVPEEARATWTLPELREDLLSPPTRVEVSAWAGLLDDELVAAGMLTLPLRDNLTRAELAVFVPPARRRSGHGTAMLEHLVEMAHDRGRSVLAAEAAWGPEPVDGAGEPGPEFARRHGFALGLVEVMRVLDLPADHDRLQALLDDAAPRHAAYTLRTFVGRIPDDLVEGWAALAATLMTEAPVGDLTLEAEDPDVALVREQEATMGRQARTRYATVALAADGTLAGYTELVTTEHEPDRAYQWGTLVHRDHRGHRLGQALKARNHLLLDEECPHLRSVRTWNAESNSHMVGVNVALGFRAVARFGGFERA